METIKHLCALSQLRLKSTQIFIVAGAVLLTLLTTIVCFGLLVRYEVDNEVVNIADVSYWKDKLSPEQQQWFDLGIDELNLALNWNSHSQSRHPRNVLLVVVRGVETEHLASGRFTSQLPATTFVWDRFAHVARLRNSCSAGSHCDGGSMATALLGGVSVNPQTVGVDSSVKLGNCSTSLDPEHHVNSVLRQAQRAGLRTGFVTTECLTSPIGAAVYAHVPDASWECDASMAQAAIEEGCEDMALQLISSKTAQYANVLMGGGRQLLNAKVPTHSWDAPDEELCQASDGRNLLREWRRQKLRQGTNLLFDVVQHEAELQALNGSRLDYLLGVLANGNVERNSKAPTLQLMLDKTLEVLQRENSGYLLIVEQYFKENITNQLRDFNRTFANLLDKFGDRETLTLVLFTNGNYLSYGLDTSTQIKDITNLQDLFDEEHLFEAYFQNMTSDHLLFAQGPKSSLFHGVRDQTFLAHAIAFALRI